MPTGFVLTTAIILVVFLLVFVESSSAQHFPLTFSCDESNDLYQTLIKSGSGPFPRYSTPREAALNAPTGSGLLILADGYPSTLSHMDLEVFLLAVEKKLRVYIEFHKPLDPLALDTSCFKISVPIFRPRKIDPFERAVVNSTFFRNQGLEPMRLIGLQGAYCAPHFLALNPSEVHLRLARVAGYNSAIFGLPPPNETQPILYVRNFGNNFRVLEAAAKLSNFITGRYSPQNAWISIWNGILTDLSNGTVKFSIKTEPSVRPSYQRQEPLPPDAEMTAFLRGTSFFFGSRLLPTPRHWLDIQYHVWIKHDTMLPPPAVGENGDGSFGIVQCYAAEVGWDGSQVQQINTRSDCQAESAAAISLLCWSGNCPQVNRDTATNILIWLYERTDAQQGVNDDPSDSAYGLVKWGIDPIWRDNYYGDDNARVILGSIVAAAALKTDRFDESITKALLGNLRTTGKYGFRKPSINYFDLQKLGWQYFFNSSSTILWPHFESYLWACNLWAYRQTKFELFLNRTKPALQLMMNKFPSGWSCTNGFSQEMARMLLPLSWLVRVEDTPQHREWLRTVASEFLKLQQPCGAIKEKLGTPPTACMFPPPQKNADYGINEGPLGQTNADPVSDMLYTVNFAFLGLHEAVFATGEQLYIDAENKLAQFLVRIQARSEKRPELDGGWFRAFDFEMWEPWGSGSDVGWGPTNIESGWTQGWITTVLGLRSLNTSLWDMTQSSTVSRFMNKLVPRFFG